MRARATILGVLLSASASASAAPAWGLPELMQAFAQVSAVNSKFVERRESIYLNAPVVLSGELRYAAPQRLEKHTLAPVDERFVADGDRLSVERVVNGKAQSVRVNLHDYPQLRPLIDGVRATLAGDGATLARYYTPGLTGNAQAWRLRLLPREAALRERISEVRIDGHAATIASVEIHEASGDISRMRITSR